MNSNHLTLYSRYEEETKWSVTQGKYNHIKKEAQTVISTTQESLGKLSCIHFVIQNRSVLQNYSTHPMGSNPHFLKKMQIYT